MPEADLGPLRAASRGRSPRRRESPGSRPSLDRASRRTTSTASSSTERAAQLDQRAGDVAPRGRRRPLFASSAEIASSGRVRRVPIELPRASRIHRTRSATQRTDGVCLLGACSCDASRGACSEERQSPSRVILASASWHSMTRCLTGSSSGGRGRGPRSGQRPRAPSPASRFPTGGRPASARSSGSDPPDRRERAAAAAPGRLLPHSGRDQQPVSQGDRIHRAQSNHPKGLLGLACEPRRATLIGHPSAGSLCLTAQDRREQVPLLLDPREHLLGVEREQPAVACLAAAGRPRPRSPGVETVGRSRARTE